MITILAPNEGRSTNLTLAITIVGRAILLFSIAVVMNSLETAQAQPAPWPSVATFWATVEKVGGSAQPEFTGCYAGVLIVYMPGRGALRQDAIVLTKDHNLCTLLQTAYITGHQGMFRAKLMSDPLDQRYRK